MKQPKPPFLVQSPAHFGAYLRSLRRSRRMTQRELGRRLGVTGARISEIEKDPGGVGLTQVLRLLHALGARAAIEVREEPLATGRKRSAPAGEW